MSQISHCPNEWMLLSRGLGLPLSDNLLWIFLQSPSLRWPSLCILSLIIWALAPLCLLWALLHVTPAIRHLQLPSAVIRSVILTRRKFLSASALARSHILASLEQTQWVTQQIVTLAASSESGYDTAWVTQHPELSSALRREADSISLTEELTNVTMMKPMCD